MGPEARNETDMFQKIRFKKKTLGRKKVFIKDSRS